MDEEIGKSSLNWTLLAVVCVCITACFCFGKMEATTSETKEIEQLKIANTQAEANKLVAQRELYIAQHTKSFEYRPITTALFTRALNTAYLPSIAQSTLVVFSNSILSTLSLTTGQTGTILFQTSSDGVTYTTQSTVVNGNTGTLVVGLNTGNTQGVPSIAIVPRGYYYKLVSSGASTFTVSQTQETQL